MAEGESEKKCEIGVVGVSHATAPMAVRERFAFSQRERLEAMSEFSEQLQEVVMVSTCNRMEIYFVSEDAESSVRDIRTFLSRWFERSEARRSAGRVLNDGSAQASCSDETRSPAETSSVHPQEGREASSYLYSYVGTEAVRHLFTVAGGLDSAVLGEDQILAQLKEALAFSLELKFSGKRLNRLFMDALAAGKSIRSQLHISEIPLSVSYIGMLRIREEVGTLHDKSVLVLGGGEMSQLALRYLQEDEPEHVYVANRTPERIRALQEEFPSIEAVPFGRRYEVLSRADVLITATTAPHFLVRSEDFFRAAGAGTLTILDMSLPADVDPKIAVQYGAAVRLFNLDDLSEESEQNYARRRELAARAQPLLDETVRSFEHWLEATAADETLKHLEERIQTICADSMVFLGHKTDLDSRETQWVEKVLSYALHRMTRNVVRQLKSEKGSDAAVRALAETWFREEE